MYRRILRSGCLKASPTERIIGPERVFLTKAVQACMHIHEIKLHIMLNIIRQKRSLAGFIKSTQEGYLASDHS